MKEYGSGKGYKYGFLVFNLAAIPLFIWGIFNAVGLNKVFSGVMLGTSLLGLVAIFKHKIILGEDYIERIYFRRRRVFFKDIVQVIIENHQAFVISSDVKLHIGQEISNRTQLLQTLLERVKPFQRAQVLGDYFVISHLLSEEKEALKPNDGLTSSRQGLSAVNAKLITKRWLSRGFEVSMVSGVYEVAYHGRELGYECVLVNGNVVNKKDSYLWYVPEFQFHIGGLPAKIKIRVWPWFAIRSFTLEIAGNVVYQEG